MNGAVGGRVQRLVLPKLDTFGDDSCACKYLREKRNAQSAEAQTPHENRNAQTAETKKPRETNHVQ